MNEPWPFGATCEHPAMDYCCAPRDCGHLQCPDCKLFFDEGAESFPFPEEGEAGPDPTEPIWKEPGFTDTPDDDDELPDTVPAVPHPYRRPR